MTMTMTMTMTTTTKMCLASASTSNVKTEQLRFQLDQLHAEAETTRRKANNARFRLLRLSEAAEKLCRQAAVCVQVGKENEARDLLLQKKKIMLALEKSKGRVELLAELAAKLNEAISIKEASLVRNIASDLEFGKDDTDSPVQIVSPAQDTGKSLHNDNNLIIRSPDIVTDQILISDINNGAEMLSSSDGTDVTVPESISSGNKASLLSGSKGVSLYIDFLEHLDQHLKKIEEDLVSILEVSTLVLEDEEKPKNSRVQQIQEILENIHCARIRIQDLVQKSEKTR